MDISLTAQYDDVRCYFEFMDTSATPQYDGIGWIATKRCRVSRNDGLRGFLFVGFAGCGSVLFVFGFFGGICVWGCVFLAGVEFFWWW